MYGQDPPTVHAYENGTTKVDLVDQSLKDKDRVMAILKSNFENAQCRINVQSDKHMSKRVLNVGDRVYLRLVLYHHMSLASHPFYKIQPRFYGPFQILCKVGFVAYKLQLPEHFKQHPIFHIACLKKHLGATIKLLCRYQLSQILEFCRMSQWQF